jgi:hypothetical protein
MSALIEKAGGRVFVLALTVVIVLVLNAKNVLDLGLDPDQIWQLVAGGGVFGGIIGVRDIMGKKKAPK